MKLTYKSIIYSLSLLFITCAVSCVDNNEDIKGPSLDDEVEFEFKIATRTPTDPESLEDNSHFFQPGESNILISQRTDNIGFSFDERSGNCYKYIYNPPEDLSSINWDQGTNFTSESPMSWQRLQNYGPYTSVYSFGALYFPKLFTQTDRVLTDQSTEDAFIENDILGAYHSTNEIGSRLAFQFNHLMCRLKVNLYIPIYNEETDKGFDFEEVIATGLSFHTDFEINFADRTSEYPPLADPKDNNGEKNDIIMYQSAGPEEIHLTAEDLLKYNRIEDGDDVRKYTFEMIFPQQTVEGNILRFTMKRGDMTYNYLLDTTLTWNKENFKFTRGQITELELYLPRNANEIVLLRGYEHDWNEASASFTITEEKKDDVSEEI